MWWRIPIRHYAATAKANSRSIQSQDWALRFRYSSRWPKRSCEAPAYLTGGRHTNGSLLLAMLMQSAVKSNPWHRPGFCCERFESPYIQGSFVSLRTDELL